MRTHRIAMIAAAGALVLAGCDSTQNANKQEAQAQADIAGRYLNAQPIPALPWSQYRQTIIDAETAQANGTQTTSFWFTRGAGGQGAPIGSCPSLGFPVPAAAQLSNPEVPIWGPSQGSSATVSQMEPNGVYTGPTDGTYVVCAGSGGKPYLTYVEADVVTVGGPAEWRDGQVRITGDPTIKPGVKK